MSKTPDQNPHPLQLTGQSTPFWPNIEIKGRIRQALARRIRGIINCLDQNLKTRISGVSVLIPVLLLSTTQGQTTFNQFTDVPSKDEAPEIDDGDGEENGGDEELSTDNPDKCVLIYVRVSTDEQKRNGRSIDSQIDELESIVNNDPEIELYQEPIRDEGETGTDFDRDGIQKVSRLAQKSEVTHLMVDTIDRIGRSVAETLMFVHELREKFGVSIMTRTRELDVRKPTDRLQVTMQATMADFSTRNRARSSKRSSADNFIKNKQWDSWFHGHIPFGYEPKDEHDTDEGGWIQRVEKLEPVIKDIYTHFINSETPRYSDTAEEINKKHEDTLKEYDGIEGKSLTSRQVKAILNRPVYRGEPTIPVTDLEHYDPYPSVNDPDLKFVDKETSQKAQEICDQLAEKYGTDEDLTIDPEDYPDEFNPYIIETVSPIVRLVCPECGSDLIFNGHQRRLDGALGSRAYKCTNDDCGHERRWPRESERQMMEMLSELDELHSIL